MRIMSLLFFFLLIPIQAMVGTFVCTGARHLLLNLIADTEVVRLEGPDGLQQAIFGDLSSDPQQAAPQAQQVIQLPAWPQKQKQKQAQKQAQIAGAYRQVVHAWEIGLHKYPAVVLYARDMVYGTADVAQANLRRTQEEDARIIQKAFSRRRHGDGQMHQLARKLRWF